MYLPPCLTKRAAAGVVASTFGRVASRGATTAATQNAARAAATRNAAQTAAAQVGGAAGLGPATAGTVRPGATVGPDPAPTPQGSRTGYNEIRDTAGRVGGGIAEMAGPVVDRMKPWYEKAKPWAGKALSTANQMAMPLMMLSSFQGGDGAMGGGGVSGVSLPPIQPAGLGR